MLIHSAVDNDIHPPRFGGAQRSFGLARGLARRHEVRVLCVTPNRAPGPERERVDGVELVRRRSWHTSVAWRLERARLAPLFTAASGHRANAKRYAAALGAGADVFAADLNLGGMLGVSNAPLRLHTSHNVEYDRFRRSAPPVLARSRWAERLRRLEQRAVDAAHVTVVCTEEDAARMRELYGLTAARLEVVPNGYDETRLAPPSAGERRRARQSLGYGESDYVAVFVGADWGPIARRFGCSPGVCCRRSPPTASGCWSWAPSAGRCAGAASPGSGSRARRRIWPRCCTRPTAASIRCSREAAATSRCPGTWPAGSRC